MIKSNNHFTAPPFNIILKKLTTFSDKIGQEKINNVWKLTLMWWLLLLRGNDDITGAKLMYSPFLRICKWYANELSRTNMGSQWTSLVKLPHALSVYRPNKKNRQLLDMRMRERTTSPPQFHSFHLPWIFRRPTDYPTPTRFRSVDASFLAIQSRRALTSLTPRRGDERPHPCGGGDKRPHRL